MEFTTIFSERNKNVLHVPDCNYPYEGLDEIKQYIEEVKEQRNLKMNPDE